jgi:hypothetical protein
MSLFTDEAAIAARFDIPSTRSNLRRIQRAIQIVDANQSLPRSIGVKFLGTKEEWREYQVHPQGANPKMRGTGEKYLVRHFGNNYPRCDCPDWRKPNGKLYIGNLAYNYHRCKHGIAVLLVEDLQS